jgi:hypothetical protein
MALGDRLVFNNGILFLALACGILIILFNADTHKLVPLFAVGAFLAFSLSQIGMVVHWIKIREKGWQIKALLNLVGGVMTIITLLVVGVTMFLDGAWISIIIMIALVFIFLKIKGHYNVVARELTLQRARPVPVFSSNPRIVIPISSVHVGVIEAMAYAKSISSDITAVHVEIEPGSAEVLKGKWQAWFPDIRLEIVTSPFRSFINPFLAFLDEEDTRHDDGQLATVLIPEFVPAKWWQSFLHNQTAWSIKFALLYRRRRLGFQRTIIDFPVHLKN